MGKYPQMVTCRVCGDEFTVTAPRRGPKAFYCSDTCRRIYKNKCLRERTAEDRRKGKKRPIITRKYTQIATCRMCGDEFTAMGARRFYCSDTCRQIYIKKYDQERAAKRTAKKAKERPVITRPCIVCGKPFIAHRTNHVICSYECQIKRGMAQQKKKRRKGIREAGEIFNCAYCGKEKERKYVKHIYCSEECRNLSRYDARRRRPDDLRILVQCAYCGKPAYKMRASNSSRRFCSQVCTRRFHGQLRKIRKKSREYDGYTNLEIFERDKWRCQICKIKTPKELRGTKAPNAPEIDHIWPISKGGDSIRSNVQCICLKCNRRKKDRTITGQTFLDLSIPQKVQT